MAETIPPVERHPHSPHSSFDGGELDCGNGLLLLIREHLDKLSPGQLLEIKSTESSVENDLPSWCRLTKNELVSWTKQAKQRSFLICKGAFARSSEDFSDTPSEEGQNYRTTGHLQEAPKDRIEVKGGDDSSKKANRSNISGRSIHVGKASSLPIYKDYSAESASENAIAIPPLSVMNIGSWPRPRWLLRALHEYLEGRMAEEEFQETADDAVRLSVDSQLRAGVDVITDGEQRRDSYASFVGKRLSNCRLIPLVDLLAMVDEPEELEKQMQSLDVPAREVRHPVVTGRIERERPIAGHELQFLKRLTDKAIKIALPGPYLLTRIMWLHCITDRVYASREDLARDIVRVLKEELHELLKEGASIVQFDEPVLTEVVFGGQARSRTFMCGALSERLDLNEELQFALNLINEVVADFPCERLGLHICRGNWSPDESVALHGDYRPLIPVLKNVKVGTLFLEFCTPRAGDLDVLSQLDLKSGAEPAPERPAELNSEHPAELNSEHPAEQNAKAPAGKFLRIGLGVTNPKTQSVESVEQIIERVKAATKFIDRDRLLLNPDCGFATFADNPVTSSDIAERKLEAMVAAARAIR